MLRPKNSTVRHGMDSCGRYGCRRDECVQAMRRANARRYQDAKRGTPQRIPADRARAHVDRLILAGMPARDIAARTGLSSSTVFRIRRGEMVRVTRLTEATLLGVPVPVGAGHGPEATEAMAKVPAFAAARRLQALSARGFTLLVLADALGCSTRCVSLLRSGKQPAARLGTVRRVAALYERWWSADPLLLGAASQRVGATAAFARTQMWAPPGAWDPEALDDPAGFPDWTGHCGTASGWLLRLVDGPAPCPACARYGLGADELTGPEAAATLARACGPALLALRQDRRGVAVVGQAVGLSERKVSVAYGIATTDPALRRGGLEVAA